MNQYFGELIGNTIGRVLDVDVDIDDTSWDSFLQVRLALNLTKSLACDRKISVAREDLWILVKYEKLPKFYFGCGRILHEDGGFSLKKPPSSKQFGVWLRAKVH